MWYVICDMWYVGIWVCGIWYVVCDMRMVCGVWYVVCVVIFYVSCVCVCVCVILNVS